MSPTSRTSRKLGVTVCRLDSERDTLPFDNESVDIVDMNQVLEKAKAYDNGFATYRSARLWKRTSTSVLQAKNPRVESFSRLLFPR